MAGRRSQPASRRQKGSAKPQSPGKRRPAPKQGKAAAAKQRKAAYGRAAGFWLLLSLVLAGTLPIAPALTLLLLGGLAPTFVAAFVNEGANKGLKTYTVLCFNISGLLPFIMDLRAAGYSFAGVVPILTDIYTWLVIYGVASVGLFAIHLGPTIAAATLQLSNNRRLAELQRLRVKLLNDWGPDLVGGG